MNAFIDPFALWLADYYLLATVLLAIALLAGLRLKQPVQRLAVVKSTIVALFLLAALCALPGWSLIHLVTDEQPRAIGSPAHSAHVSTSRNADKPLAVPPRNLDTVPTRAPGGLLSTDTDLQVETPRFEITLPAILSLAHLSGAACGLAWLVLGALAAHQLRRTAQPVPSDLQSLMNEVIHLQGNPMYPPELRSSFRIDVAVALGVFRPVVLLPTKWLTTQTRDELRTILAHECTHIRNGDLRWLATSRGLHILLWAQPLYWLLRRRMRLDQEVLADADAAELTSRQRYAEQLVSWARHIPARPRAHLSAAVGLWERPSHLRQRIALLVDERFTVLRQCSRSWRRGVALAITLSAVLLSAISVEPAASNENNAVDAETHRPVAARDAERGNATAAQRANKLHGTPSADTLAAAAQVEIPIIVARHVILHDGKIIEWADVERMITALPNPKLAHPSFKFTHGALPEREVEIRAKIWDLRQRVELRGHSWGSLSPRTSARYDAIRTAADLVPNAAWRIEGTVQTPDGLPIDGAEVVLLLPAPESLPYKSLDVYLQNERLRNADDEIVTRSDASGRFAIYPRPDTPYYVVAFHREGFGLVRSDEFSQAKRIAIQPWARIRGMVKQDSRFQQSANIRQRIPAEGEWPEITFYQFSEDLGPAKPTGEFEFAYVAPGVNGTLGRSIQGEQGTSFSLPGKEFNLASDDTLTVDIEPPTDDEAARIETLKSDDQQRRNEAEAQRAAEEARKASANKETFPISISGRAFDTEGKPIAGAEVFVSSQSVDSKRIATAKTDEAGFYSIEKAMLPIERDDTNHDRDHGSFLVFARAKGHGFAWRPQKWFYPQPKSSVVYHYDDDDDLPMRFYRDDPIELDLKFSKAASFSGRVLNSKREPIRYTQVSIWNAERVPRDGYGPQRRFSIMDNNGFQLLNADVPPEMQHRMTDAEGRFEFDNVPSGCRFRIRMTPPGMPSRMAWFATQQGLADQYDGRPLYSSSREAEISFGIPREVAIQVVYADTEQPAAKAFVTATNEQAGTGRATDREGKVTLSLPPGEYRMGILPEYKTPYLETDDTMTVSDSGPDRVTILRLRPAAQVEVRVVDQESKQGIANVDLWTGDNEFSRDQHYTSSYEVATRIVQRDRERTNAEGIIHTLFEPGRHRIGVALQSYPQGFEPVEKDGVEIDCEAGKKLSVTFHLRRRRQN